MRPKLNRALLRAFLLLGGMLPLLTGCKALRNALTPLKTEVQLIDTVYLPQVTVDTIAVTLPVDTIVIETERVSARVIRSYDTISVKAECKADTVIVTNTVTLPTKVKTVTQVPWWFKPAVGIGALLIGLALFRILVK